MGQDVEPSGSAPRLTSTRMAYVPAVGSMAVPPLEVWRNSPLGPLSLCSWIHSFRWQRKWLISVFEFQVVLPFFNFESLH